MAKRYFIPADGPTQERITDRERERAHENSLKILEKEKKNWDQDYKLHQYGNVLDLTGDSQVRKTILAHLEAGYRNVFIAGCGSKTYLQKAICALYPGIRLVCGDISREALKLAKESLNSPQIEYRWEDSTQLSLTRACFDAVIVVNSVLSPDAISRKMLSEFHRILKPGTGKLIACFPTVNCGLELAHLSQKLAFFLVNGSINYAKNTIWEEHQAVEQTFYSPIRLKNIIEETGFQLMEMSYMFLDSDHFYKQYHSLYNGLFTRENGLCLYENFVVATS